MERHPFSLIGWWRLSRYPLFLFALRRTFITTPSLGSSDLCVHCFCFFFLLRLLPFYPSERFPTNPHRASFENLPGEPNLIASTHNHRSFSATRPMRLTTALQSRIVTSSNLSYRSGSQDRRSRAPRGNPVFSNRLFEICCWLSSKDFLQELVSLSKRENLLLILGV